MATTIVKKREISTHRKTTASFNPILKDFIACRNKKSLKDLKGKISLRENYDYKSIRN